MTSGKRYLWTFAMLASIPFATSCSSSLSVFRCETSEQCVSSEGSGRCEVSGFCSFADATCPGGYRYGAAAGEESTRCVVVVDAGVYSADAPPDAHVESDAMCETCGGDICVDLETDSQHCGVCDRECDTEELCTLSQCFEKAEIVRANPVTAKNAPGLVISDGLYPGWRFEVPNSTVGFTTLEVGLMGSHQGPLFIALIQLEGSNEVPTPLDLSGVDVIATAVSDTTNVASPQDILFPLSTSLDPGWYAIVVGAGKFGSPNNANGTVWGLQEPIAMPQLPFTLVQANQSIVFQNMQARFFLRGFLTED